MRKVKTISYVILLLIFLFLGTILIVPPILGWQNVVVLSDSMEPTLHRGDLICIQPCEMSDVNTGDVITFQNNYGVYVTHRVFEVNEEGIVTKGDANSDIDAYVVNSNNFVGKMKYHIPYLGKWIQIIRGY